MCSTSGRPYGQSIAGGTFSQYLRTHFSVAVPDELKKTGYVTLYTNANAPAVSIP